MDRMSCNKMVILLLAWSEMTTTDFVVAFAVVDDIVAVDTLPSFEHAAIENISRHHLLELQSLDLEYTCSELDNQSGLEYERKKIEDIRSMSCSHLILLKIVLQEESMVMVPF